MQQPKAPTKEEQEAYQKALEKKLERFKEYQKKTPISLVIGLPGWTFSAGVLKSILSLVMFLTFHGIKFTFSIQSSCNIVFVRNMVLGGSNRVGPEQKPFQGQIDYTHILWIDSDIIFTADQFMSLILHDKDIVSGVYHMMGGYQYATVETRDDEYFKEHGSYRFLNDELIKEKKELFKCWYTGLGFMLVKKGVFESLNYPWFGMRLVEIGEVQDLSMEDADWCWKIQDKGYDVWIDPNIRVAHEKLVRL